MGRLRGIRGRRMSLVVSCPVDHLSGEKGIEGARSLTGLCREGWASKIGRRIGGS